MAEGTVGHPGGSGLAARAQRGTDRTPAWSLAVAAMFSVQLGSALSTGQFEAVGIAGTAWLRLTAAALVFLLLGRPRLRGRARGEILAAVGLGATTAVMSCLFFVAIDRIPLGTAVAIEYMGPFAVAVVGVRRARGLMWPLLAVTGVVALCEPWTGTVDPIGVLAAAGAGTGWAFYIVLSARVGGHFEGLEGLSITMPIAAALTALVGVPQAVGSLTPQVALVAFGIALLMPVLPFSLELIALRRLGTSVFGTLMSLEPAIGTAVGLVVLMQVPTPLQVVGTVLVVGAGMGAMRQPSPTPVGGLDARSRAA